MILGCQYSVECVDIDASIQYNGSMSHNIVAFLYLDVTVFARPLFFDLLDEFGSIPPFNDTYVK